MLALLPKCAKATTLQQYKSICLLIVILNVFTKLLNNRANRVVEKVVAPVQTAFIRGRYILDGVIVLHEILHEIHRKKESSILIKVDLRRRMTRLIGIF